MSRFPYHLGCPIWANPQWAGSLYSRKASRAEFLSQYSQVFNTVEVSSTFYAFPPEETIRTWADVVEPGFRFCLKFPRAISHEKQLKNTATETALFLEIVKILEDADCLGPSFLQLGPDFSAKQFPRLEAYLKQLPSCYPYAVEVRHADYFDNGKHENALNELLRQLNIDRVLLDSRPLFSAPATTEGERHAQGRKPRVPVRFDTTANQPLVRLIGRDNLSTLADCITEWSKITADWIKQGKTPFIFSHTPDDIYAPAFGRMFHRAVCQEEETVPEMPDWPGEAEPVPAKQLRLFEE